MPTNFSYIAKYGSNGTGNTNLVNPSGLVTDGVHLYICDTGNNRILKWRLCGGLYVAKVDTALDIPKDIAIFRNLLFVCDSGNHRIKIYDKNLNLKTSFGSQGSGNTNFNTPTSIVTDENNIYINDQGNSRIVAYDRNLSYSFKFGSNGSGNTQLNNPQQITYDEHEKVLYIVDFINTRVLKWEIKNNSFIYRDRIVATDSVDASLIGLNGIAVKNHYIYLLEANRVQVFDTATLTTRANAGTDGSGNTQISDGSYITTYKNTVLISDIGNDRIIYWYNYNPQRGFSSRGTIKIGGRWFQNPVIPIGGQQERINVTIGGTAESDKFLNIEEEELNDSIAGIEEI